MPKSNIMTKDEIRQIHKNIGKNVKRIRNEKGFSQLNLALSIGYKSVASISNLELCLQNKHFNIEQLIRISNVLDVDIKEFFKDIY